MPFISIFIELNAKLLAVAYRLICVSLLIKTLFTGHFEQTREALLMVGPIKEN